MVVVVVVVVVVVGVVVVVVVVEVVVVVVVSSGSAVGEAPQEHECLCIASHVPAFWDLCAFIREMTRRYTENFWLTHKLDLVSAPLCVAVCRCTRAEGRALRVLKFTLHPGV